MEFNKPNPFNPNKNQVAQDWKIWKKEFLIYLRLAGCYEKCTEEERALILQNLMGTEGVRAMEKMTFDHPNEKDDMDILIMKFDQIFDPPLNEVEERYKFFSRKFNENENIDNYITDLKNRASTCNFGLQSEKFVIDMVIRNLNSYLRDVIFAIEDLSLNEVVHYYKQFVINNDKIKELTKSAVSSNSKASKDTRNSDNTKARLTKSADSELPRTGFTQVQYIPMTTEIKPVQPRFCWKCSSRHVQGKCPAYGKICNVCYQRNHFNGLCSKQTKNSQKEETKRICSKCGTNHPYKQCPAYDNLCGKCHMKGHFVQHCKQQKPADEINQNTNTVKNTDNMQKLFKPKLEDCSWCELKHVQNECPHSTSCTRCETFPHNICFQCKKNPHDDNCHYKRVITLPPKTCANDKPSVQNCINCGMKHGNSPCNAFLQYCNKCKRHGHLAHICELFQKQNNPVGSTVYEPLLKEQRPSSGINNERTIPTSSTSNANYSNNVNYQKSSPASSTSNANYSNNVNYQKSSPASSTSNANSSSNRQNPTTQTYSKTNSKTSYRSNFEKRDEKPDACTIS